MAKKQDLRGRPTSSPIRDNLIELIFFLKESYGYDLYKKYVRIFGQNISIRSIYYHLNKGVELGEFRIHTVEDVQGNYSWGNQVKRVVFALGPNAKPKRSKEVLSRIKDVGLGSKNKV